jgi:hypothetical protein
MRHESAPFARPRHARKNYDSLGSFCGSRLQTYTTLPVTRYRQYANGGPTWQGHRNPANSRLSKLERARRLMNIHDDRTCQRCNRSLPWELFYYPDRERDCGHCFECFKVINPEKHAKQEHADRNNSVFLTKYKYGNRGDGPVNTGFGAWARSLYKLWMERMRTYQPQPTEFVNSGEGKPWTPCSGSSLTDRPAEEVGRP